jgi:adenosylmethionine-8-amino-7-oxononanoate aminotransferase
VAARGPKLRRQLEDALRGVGMVREVRGHGYLLGIEYVDPRDGESFLPPDLGVAGRIDDIALERGLVILSTQPTGDGMAGDQSLFAPPFVTTDEELDEMVARFAEVVHDVASEVDKELAGLAGPPQPVPAGDAQ